MTLLHIDSSILGDDSASRQVSAAIVARLRALDPALAVVYRDLAAAPLSHLGGAQVAARFGAPVEDETIKAQIAHDDVVLDEFLAADTVVIGAPMYNFALPSQLKAWIDRILVAGRTFRYGESGPVGLAVDKRVIVALSRGNFYGPGAPAAGLRTRRELSAHGLRLHRGDAPGVRHRRGPAGSAPTIGSKEWIQRLKAGGGALAA